jgi:hypothetical protein
LQTLIRPDLVPNAILALQTIAFRPDWGSWYAAVSARPNEFRDAIRKYHQRDPVNNLKRSDVISNIEDFFKKEFQDDLTFSDDLLKYLASDLTLPLAKQRNLDPYLSSLQSTSTPDTGRPGGDLARLLMSDLLRIAQELEIPDAGRMRKSDLVTAIRQRTNMESA